jgi:hypothetical protein
METKVPKHLCEIGDTGMTNLDHSYDKEILEKVRNGEGWTRYAGWNFNGRVWFGNNEYHCEVWHYGSPCNVISADTPENLMQAVSYEWGCE